MGGHSHAARQEGDSSHQTTVDQLTPTDNLHSVDTNVKLYQPETLPGGITQPSTHLSSPSGLDLAQSSSTAELMSDGNEENLYPIQQELVENEEQPFRTADIQLSEEDTELIKSTSPSSEPQNKPPHVGKLSLFSGMELVTKGRLLCDRDASQTELDKTDNGLIGNQTVHNSDRPVKSSTTCINSNEGSPSVCNSHDSDSSQPVSAFSFLNC